MGLWRWITGRLTVLPSDLYRWQGIFGSDNDSGEPVTPDTAQKLSAWWSAKRLNTETIATLPCNIFQKDGDDRKARPDHWAYTLLHDLPNSEQTPVEWWEGRVGPLMDYGNSYAEKRFLGDRVVALEPLPAAWVAPYRRPSDNALIYKYSDRGKVEELPPAKVLHIKGFAPNDEDCGLSPVEYATRSLGGAISAERAAARVYSRGLRASGFFTPPVDMNADQRKQFEDNYIKPGEGIQGQGKTLIFPPGFDWKSMNITPKDAEMVMSRSFNVADVCRWMRVPPILIGHSQEGQTMWGTGVEQIILGWLALGLRAYLRRIEAAINTRLLTPADRASGLSFEFNFEGLLRADSAARAALMSTFVQNGLRTRDEMRKVDNYPAMGGKAGELTVQSNMTTLDALGQQQQAANDVRNAMRSWLLEEKDAA